MQKSDRYCCQFLNVIASQGLVFRHVLSM